MVTLTAQETALSHSAKGAATSTAPKGTKDRIKWLLSYAMTACAINSERRQLRKLTDAQLQDIGITRQQVNQESSRGFFDIPPR